MTKLNRESALELAQTALERWCPEELIKQWTIVERQQLILAFAILFVKTAQQFRREELQVEWANDERFELHVIR
jgi:hypothetical protein